MQVTETKSEGLSKEFAVVIPASTLEAEMEEQLRAIQGQVRMKGFRPGKAPLSLLKRMHGANVMGDVIQKAVSTSSNKVLEDNEVNPATQPSLEITKYEEGGDLEYKIAVDIMPDIPEQDFAAIEVERLVLDEAEIEKEVEMSLENLAKAHRSYTPKAEGAEAADGDSVTIDFEGRIDGELFDGGSSTGVLLVIGSESFIPGFEEQLVGAKAGDKREVTVTFPEAYGATELAGKTAVFDVTVQEVSEPGEVAVNDDVAKNFGMETLEELREALAGRIRNDFGELTRERLKRTLLDKLDDMYQFDLPERMVENEAQSVAHQLGHNDEDGEETDAAAHDHDHDRGEDHAHAHDHDHDGGHGHDDEGEHDHGHTHEITDEHRKLATRRVKLGLALSEIGRRHSIEVTDDEVQKRVAAEAAKYPGREREFLQFVRENPQAIQNFRMPVFEDKVVDFILELATVNDKVVDKDTLLSDPDAGEKAG